VETAESIDLPVENKRKWNMNGAQLCCIIDRRNIIYI
jgi:hypothetical protein